LSLTLEIRGLAYGGAGLGRSDDLGGRVVFVPFTAPGDVVEAEVVLQKKRYAEASVQRVIRPSPLRVEPACPVFGICGGCDLQHMDYRAQVEWKERIFSETLTRIGGIKLPSLDAALPSDKEYHYRSKARFQVRGGRWGFFRKGTTEVVDIEECPIAEPPVNSAFREIRAFIAGERRMRPLQGVLSFVEIGYSPLDNKVVASLGLKRNMRGTPWKALLRGVLGLKGLEARDLRGRGRGRLVFREGDMALSSMSAGFALATPMGSFSQINRDQNERLIERVMEYADLKGEETIMELYCGAGNLTRRLGGTARRVLAVDSDHAAISAARRVAGAGANRQDGVEFMRARAAAWLQDNLKTLENTRVDMVVLDPPRTGDKEAMKWLARLGPERIIYVSCAPPTMARDMKVLAQNGYKLKRASIIDLFPQTGHIEGICLLERGAQEKEEKDIEKKRKKEGE